MKPKVQFNNPPADAGPFTLMRQHYLNRDLAAREWKRQGGKVLGYFCNSVPEELAMAAGFLPVRLSGDPWGCIDTARRHYVSRARNREDFVHSMLDRLLVGEYDYLDYLVVPHARETIRRLYPVLLQARENLPDGSIPEVYYLDVLHTRFLTSGQYNAHRLKELKRKFEEWSGQEITNEGLREAITITNESKRLLGQMAALRTASPPAISGMEALTIIGSSMFMSKRDHNALLADFLNAFEPSGFSPGARLFAVGSPMDNLQLYEIIESCGATVVAEDNCWGNRIFDLPIDSDSEPETAISERYNQQPPCSRNFPLSARVDYCRQSVLASLADGAIFFVYERDSAEAWETPDKITALTEMGIPSLYLKKQPYLLGDHAGIKAQVYSFISTLQERPGIS